MVIAETMNKSVVKISVSDSESSEDEDSDNEVTVEAEATVINSKVDSNAAGSDADKSSQSDSNDENENLEESEKIANEGWADSLAKILGSSKPKNKKTLVLSRAKKHSEEVKSEKEKKPDFEVIGKEEQVDPSSVTDATEPVAKKKKLEKPSIRVKPTILEKDREKILSKIATKGVVQLFNAVRNQQKSIEKQIDRKDLTETKKEKILKKFDKRTFLDTLMGNTKSVVVDDQAKVKKDENAPKWKALREDYMLSAKMKDWDKEVDE